MTDFLDRFPRFGAAMKRLAEHRSERAGGPGYREAIDTIADEIIPAILGDAWKRAQRQPFFMDLARASSLIDHPEYLRRASAHGPHTWRNLVLISQPYAGFNNDICVVGREANRMVERKVPLGVWGVPRLGPWNPPGTSLVLLAPGLIGRNAAEFGFSDLVERT